MTDTEMLLAACAVLLFLILLAVSPTARLAVWFAAIVAAALAPVGFVAYVLYVLVTYPPDASPWDDWTLLAMVAAAAILCLGVAWWGDRRPRRRERS